MAVSAKSMTSSVLPLSSKTSFHNRIGLFDQSPQGSFVMDNPGIMLCIDRQGNRIDESGQIAGATDFF